MALEPAPLRFVVLRHEGVPEPHFDWMFERIPGSALATWRSHVWPPQPGARLVRLADHRREYLAYEGPVSGGRGEVRRVAEGTFRLNRDDGATWDVTLLLPEPAGGRRFLLARVGDEWDVVRAAPARSP